MRTTGITFLVSRGLLLGTQLVRTRHYSTMSKTFDDFPDKFQKVCENKNYVILNKANGVDLMNDGRFAKYTPGLLDIIKFQIDDQLRGVHRIDKVVTGGLLVAKNQNSARMFSRYLKNGGSKGYIFKRRYVALISKKFCGRGPSADSVFLSEEDEKKGIIHTSENGVESITKFIEFPELHNGTHNLCVIQLETGRKHQIRRHLSEYLDRPIYNDRKYGARLDESEHCNAIGLHSSFIYTKVGMQQNEVLIPVRYVPSLWKGFIDEEGWFPSDINKTLRNFDTIFSGV